MMWKLSRALLLCSLASSCVAPKRAHLIVPQHCIRLNAESFTRPCTTRPDGKLLCDGVVVTANCMQAQR
jgi:hypothetical protein